MVGDDQRPYAAGDTIFLYATKPTQELTHQCVVVEIGLSEGSADTAADAWVDDEAYEERKYRTWMDLRLVRMLTAEECHRLNLTAMQNACLNGGVQRRRRASGGVLILLHEALLGPSPSPETDPTAEDFPTDDKLIEPIAAQIDGGHYAVLDFETYVPDRYAYQKTRGSAQKAFTDRVKSKPEFLSEGGQVVGSGVFRVPGPYASTALRNTAMAQLKGMLAAGRSGLRTACGDALER